MEVMPSAVAPFFQLEAHSGMFSEVSVPNMSSPVTWSSGVTTGLPSSPSVHAPQSLPSWVRELEEEEEVVFSLVEGVSAEATAVPPKATVTAVAAATAAVRKLRVVKIPFGSFD